MGYSKINTVVLFDRVFVYLNSATTIEAVMRTQGRNSSGKRARSPKSYKFLELTHLNKNFPVFIKRLSHKPH